MHLSVGVCFDWLSVSYSCGGACAQQDKRGGATGEICSMPTVQRWRMGLLSMHIQRTQQQRTEESETVWPIHWNDYVNKRLVWQIILWHPRLSIEASLLEHCRLKKWYTRWPCRWTQPVVDESWGTLCWSWSLIRHLLSFFLSVMRYRRENKYFFLLVATFGEDAVG